jgi:hypothetical protein
MEATMIGQKCLDETARAGPPALLNPQGPAPGAQKHRERAQ